MEDQEIRDDVAMPGELHNVMYLALMQNRVDFVKLFMETGLGLQDFLTVERMTQMYDEIPKNTFLYDLLKREEKGSVSKQKSTLEHIGRVIQMLMGDSYIPLYLRDNRYLPGYTSTLKGGEFLKDDHRKPDFDEPARELFIWCVLLNRLEMAKIFWDEGREGVAAALVAQKLINSMLTRMKDSELEQCMKSSQEHFEKLSVECLRQCYASDERKVRRLLVRQMNNFGKTTVLKLAVKADNKEFIAHSACQALLNNMWRGRIALDVNNFCIWLSVLCPPLLFFLIRYSEDDGHQLADEASHSRKAAHRKIERNDTSLPLNAEESQQNRISGNSRNNRRTSRRDTKTCKKLTVWQRIKYFYNAPMIILRHNCLSYMTFIIFYSILLLTRFNKTMDVWDYLLIFWVITLFAEEIRQVATDESSSIRLKLTNCFIDEWNILDAVTILSFMAGVILRLIPGSVCPECFCVARIVLTINLMTFCYRILHIFSVHKELGPKWVMIRRMMVDIFFFIIILIVFITAFGLASQAILYPNSTLDWALLRDVFKKPYWQMYGELYLEELEGDVTCTSDSLLWRNGTQTRCPHAHWIVPALLGVYILITNVLMPNLLIAMFRVDQIYQTVEKIKDTHFIGKETIFSTDNTTNVLEGLAYLEDQMRRTAKAIDWITVSMVKRGQGLITSPPVYEDIYKRREEQHRKKQEIANKEKEDYQRHLLQQLELQVQNLAVSLRLPMVDQLSQSVEKIKEMHFIGKATTSLTGNTTNVLEGLAYLEDQMRRTAKAIDWITVSMVKRGQGLITSPPVCEDIYKRREEQHRKKQEIANKEKEEFQRCLLQQLELQVQNLAVSLRLPMVDQLSQAVKKLKETHFISKATTSSTDNTTNVLERLAYLKDQMRRTAKALDWITVSMVKRGQGLITSPPVCEDIYKRREEQHRKKQEIANKEKEDYQRHLLQQLELQVQNLTISLRLPMVDQLSQAVEKIKETHFIAKATTSSTDNTTNVLEGIAYLKDQMRRTAKALDWIIGSMVERGQGSKTNPPALVDIDKRREELHRKKPEIANKEKEDYQRRLLQQLELQVQNLAVSLRLPMTEATPTFPLKGITLEKVRERQRVVVHWKQGSFFGIGGDKSQAFIICQYKIPGGPNIPVYINDRWSKPSRLVVDRKLRYGMNRGILFLVLDDMKHKPYQHRFIQNLMQMGLYAGNARLRAMTSGLVDLSWVVEDHLRRI